MKKSQSFLRVSLALLALSCLLFAGCSDSSDDSSSLPPAGAPVAVEPMTGIQMYVYSTGNAYSGSAISFTKFTDNNQNFVTLASAGLTFTIDVDTNGKFNLDLSNQTPNADALVDFRDFGISVSPADARFLQIGEFRTASDSPRLERINLEGDEEIIVDLIYATKDAVVSGTTSDGSARCNLNLKAGWNWVRHYKDRDPEELVSGSVDGDYKWYIR